MDASSFKDIRAVVRALGSDPGTDVAASLRDQSARSKTSPEQANSTSVGKAEETGSRQEPIAGNDADSREETPSAAETIDTAMDLGLLGVVECSDPNLQYNMTPRSKAMNAARFLQRAMSLHAAANDLTRKALELLPSTENVREAPVGVRFKPIGVGSTGPIRSKVADGKTVFTCQICGMSHASWSGSDSHMRKEHTGDQYGPCPKCKNFFTYNLDSMRSHVKKCSSVPQAESMQ